MFDLQFVSLIPRSPLAQMEEERREHVMKMKKMEAEMEQVFEMKVKEKKQKLKDSEAEVCGRVGVNLSVKMSLFLFIFVIIFVLSKAWETPRTDEEELGGAVQRAGGKEASVWRGEEQLGDSAKNSGAAETRRFQVSNTFKLYVVFSSLSFQWVFEVCSIFMWIVMMIQCFQIKKGVRYKHKNKMKPF